MSQNKEPYVHKTTPYPSFSDLENANTKIIQLINLKKNTEVWNTENKENSYHISSFCEDDIQDELMAPDLDASDVSSISNSTYSPLTKYLYCSLDTLIPV